MAAYRLYTIVTNSVANKFTVYQKFLETPERGSRSFTKPHPETPRLSGLGARVSSPQAETAVSNRNRRRAKPLAQNRLHLLG